MRSSVINHPENEPLIIIRQWQLAFCDGNEVAAALLSFFEYWHNIKIDMASQNAKANEVAEHHGDSPDADISLYQWHTEAELISGIQRIAKSGKTLTKGIDILINKDAITVHKNPNPKYAFDKKRYFLFYPDAINDWIGEYRRSSKNTLSTSKIPPRQGKIPPPSGKIPPAITEITSEITSETIKPLSAVADFSRPVSFLSENEVRSIELKISDWTQYLADEQLEKQRKGIINFIEGKIRHWALMPRSDAELKFFEILDAEYDADGKVAPKKFPSLETKRLFNEAAEFHNGTLETVIKTAIHKRGKGIQKITDYINSPEWRKGPKNGQAKRGRSGSQSAGGQAQGRGFQPGNGRTPEMQAALEAAFAPKLS